MEKISNLGKKAGQNFAVTARKFAGEIALILVVIGALNWGVHALNDDNDLLEMLRDLLEKIMPRKLAHWIVKIIYLTVSVAGLFVLYERYFGLGKKPICI